ncbi:MAG: hypothetical protein V1750_03020 [Acidobacteriota bacterium]
MIAFAGSGCHRAFGSQGAWRAHVAGFAGTERRDRVAETAVRAGRGSSSLPLFRLLAARVGGHFVRQGPRDYTCERPAGISDATQVEAYGRAICGGRLARRRRWAQVERPGGSWRHW